MRRHGFTIMEMIIVIMVGGVLLAITVSAFGAVQSRTSVRQARNVFAGLHARARAHAIEFGTTTRLEVDVGGDSAWITRNDTTLERISFADEFGVELSSEALRPTLCMSPRGYADTDCTNFGVAVTLTFQQGAEAMEATMLPLGQLQMPGNR